jgi:hypothetical protein
MPEDPALDPSRTIDHVPALQAPSIVDDTGAYQPTGATGPYLPVPPADAPSIPGYRINAEVAHGGMGRVYAGHEPTPACPTSASSPIPPMGGHRQLCDFDGHLGSRTGSAYRICW